ncbi:SCO7613 C-terminal domain-containing membrane protein [Salinibacterium sp. GXW1014]|uniref:SCO7613 C-terminal domain-containing membrane protein n=1 Tax=Salinibacterium sp. GXW1014 TaxID=3377838 RepID=UPI00383A41F3
MFPDGNRGRDRAPSTGEAEARGPRRSGVQLALLVTGISLLSVFAIFFMVYAFINYGLVWRSIIIASVTVAAFVTAGILRRRSLSASSEAVAVFALVLTYLDAFAIRANDLFGVASVDGARYWGIVLLASGVAFITWHRLSSLRAASLVGYLAIPVGTAVLASSLVASLETGADIFAVAIATALSGIVQHTAWLRTANGRRPAQPERLLVTLVSAPALLAAVASSFLMAPQLAAGASLALVGSALVAALHTVLHVRSASSYDRVGAALSGAVAGGALALAGAAYGLRVLETSDLPLLTIAAPTLAAALLVTLLLRLEYAAYRVPLRLAAGTAAVVALLATAPAVTLALANTTAAVAESLLGARGDASELRVWFLSELDAVAGTLALVLAAVAAAAVLRSLARVAPVLGVTASVAALLLPSVLPSLWLMIAGWIALGAAGLVLRRRWPHLRASFTTAAIGGLGLAWLAGWGSDSTWPVTSVVALAAIILTLRTAQSELTRVSLATTGTGVVVLAAAAAAEHFAGGTGAEAVGALAGAAGLFLLTAVFRTPVRSAEARGVFWAALASAVVASVAVAAQWSSDMPLPVLTVTSFALIAAGACAWLTLRKDYRAATEQYAAALTVAPTLAFGLSVAATVWLPSGPMPSFAPALVAAVVTAVALLLHTSLYDTGGRANRQALEVGAALAFVPPFLATLSGRIEDGWIVLALAAITIALAATSADGLVGSRSRRRHLGWVALAFATAALWWALDTGNVVQPEPYVLPPALGLVVIALLIRRREARSTDGGSARVSPWVLLFALALAIVPLAFSTAAPTVAETLRAVLTLTVSAALLLGASLLVSRRSAVGATARLAAAAASVGLIGTVIVTVIRSDTALTEGEPLEAWLLPGVAALAVAGSIVARIRSNLATGPARIASTTGHWVFRGAIVLAVGAEVAAANESDAGLALLRILVLVFALCALHVIALQWTAPPLGVVTAWTSLALAALVAVLGSWTVDHVELLSAPIALALIAGGAITLRRVPESRSWPHLGPGIALLLLPTLLATFFEPEVWRLVALGVVAVLTIVAGVAFRLQAPFVIGTVVVLAHALRTFAPQIRAVYEAADWYVWAGIGGAILLALAIRYEQRVRDVARIVTRIGSLR